ncbi:MAG: D-alanyl-D-alanine carboxypeptidase [Abditibacteriota bacterium]|nr:D-alanyl-D-alanine carboxypeptidase [Abditibacteriota bacterium]
MKKVLFVILFSLLSVIVFARPDSNAKAYIVMEQNTGHIIYSKNMNQKLPMASTTKIMTAIVYLENNPTDPIIYTTEALNTSYGNMLFPVGTKISKTDALKALLLPSSNDMATAFKVSLKDKDFVSLMNQKAKALGMKNTHYVNVHGLDTEGHYSTCRDLAILGSYAMKNKSFRDSMVPKAKITLDIKGQKKEKLIESTFKDFYNFKGAGGIKTGTTTGAGKCFVGYVKRNDIPLVTVVLGDRDALVDTKNIINYTYNHCKEETLLSPGEIYKVKYGKKDISVNVSDLVKIFSDPKDSKIEYKFVFNKHYPIAKNIPVGYVNVFDRNNYICTKTLYSEKSYQNPREIWFFIFVLLLLGGGVWYYFKK